MSQDKILILLPPKTPRQGVDSYGEYVNGNVRGKKLLFKSFEKSVYELSLDNGRKVNAIENKNSYRQVITREEVYFTEARNFYNEFISKLNIPKDNIIVKAVAPSYKYEGMNDPDKSEHIKKNFDESILVIADDPNTKLIISFSTYAASCLFGHKKPQIGKCEVFQTEYKNKLLFIINQGFEKYVTTPSRRPYLFQSMSMINACINNNFKQKDYTKLGLNYEYIYDMQKLLKNKVELVSFDTETTGLYWHQDHIRVLTVQVSIDEKNGYVIPVCPIAFPNLDDLTRTKLISQLKVWLEDSNITKTAHNWSFDTLMIWKKLGIDLQGTILDTEQLLFLYDENMPSKSLAEGCRYFDPLLAGYSDEFDRTQDKSNMTKIALLEPDKFLYYAAPDALATYRLCITLLNKLQKEKPKHLEMYFSYYEPAMKALVNNLVKNGVPIDQDKLKSLHKELTINLNTIEKDLIKTVHPLILQKHLNGGLKLSRDEFVRDILFSNDKRIKEWKADYGLKPKVFTDTGFASVSVGQHLPYFEDNPFIDQYKKYSVIDKLLTTYIGETPDLGKAKTSGMFEFIGSDSYLHSGYYLARTNTGRTSVNSPNVQALPKRGKEAKQFRECLVSRLPHETEDWVFLMPDYSQAELRVVAWESMDETMIQAYKEGKDLHTITACKIAGLTEEQFNALDTNESSLLRYKAKAVNFGECFGAWWTTLQRYAKLTYNVTLSNEEAEKMYNDFFELYPSLQTWHERCKKEGHNNGYIKMLHGRIRTLPDIYSCDKFIRKEAERQAINSRVQGFASDINILALTLLCQDIKKANLSYIKPCLSIHDQLIFRVHRAKLYEVAPAVKYYMENVPLKKVWGIESPVPLVADMAWGENLAEENKMKDTEAQKPKWCSF
jgi:DNA polymerase-1